MTFHSLPLAEREDSPLTTHMAIPLHSELEAHAQIRISCWAGHVISVPLYKAEQIFAEAVAAGNTSLENSPVINLTYLRT